MSYGINRNALDRSVLLRLFNPHEPWKRRLREGQFRAGFWFSWSRVSCDLTGELLRRAIAKSFVRTIQLCHSGGCQRLLQYVCDVPVAAPRSAISGGFSGLALTEN